MGTVFASKNFVNFANLYLNISLKQLILADKWQILPFYISQSRPDLTFLQSVKSNVNSDDILRKTRKISLKIHRECLRMADKIFEGLDSFLEAVNLVRILMF